jgi:hypothetical protein
MKITYEPFEEIVIKEYIKFEKPDDLIYAFAQLRALGQPVSLNWAEGVVFVHNVLPPTSDQVVDQYLKGRLYIAGISYALMDKYQNSVVYKSPQGDVAVPVINVSSNGTLSEVAKWLKAQPKSS